MQKVLDKCFDHTRPPSSRYFNKYCLVTQITDMPNTEVKVYHPAKIGKPFLGEWISSFRVTRYAGIWCWEIHTTKEKIVVRKKEPA